MRVLCLLLIALAAGCSVVNEQSSEILRKTAECGVGNPTGASYVAMQDWFSHHRTCATAIDEICRPVRQSAPARWIDSTEGRICTAASSVAQWTPMPNTDHERFQAGWK
jgi:hypothetical protein